MDSYLLHITNTEEWEAAQTKGIYEPASLQAEGFIHCSTFQQVTGVVNQWFQNQPSLLLLVVDTEQLQHPVKYEDLYQHGDEFPHLYGPLNLNAVIGQIEWQANADGIFEFPSSLTKFTSDTL